MCGTPERERDGTGTLYTQWQFSGSVPHDAILLHQALANSAIVQVTANHKMAMEVLEEVVRWPFAGGEAGDRGRASIKGCLVAVCLMDSEGKLHDHTTAEVDTPKDTAHERRPRVDVLMGPA